MKRLLMFLLPVAVLGLGAFVRHSLIESAPLADPQEPAADRPLVDVLALEPVTHRLVVRAFGEVEAQSIATIAARTTGELVETSPKLLRGGFFRAGETLARLDDTDARDNLAMAESQLAQAQAALALEEAQAEAAARDWEEFGEGEAPAVVLREPQLASARAAIAAAEAQLAMARTQLGRTTVTAPFDGRSLERLADLGQWVAPGTPLARIYGTAVAEVRLPLTAHDLEMLGVGADGSVDGLPVTFSDGTLSWEGVLRRMEARVDPGTRLFEAVAEIEAPFRDRGLHTLVPGMFLEAKVSGREVEGVFLVPSIAILDRERVRLVDAEDQVHEAMVTVIHDDGTQSVVTAGLAAGDRLLVTPLALFVEGMAVTPSQPNATEDEE